MLNMNTNRDKGRRDEVCFSESGAMMGNCPDGGMKRMEMR